MADTSKIRVMTFKPSAGLFSSMITPVPDSRKMVLEVNGMEQVRDRHQGSCNDENGCIIVSNNSSVGSR